MGQGIVRTMDNTRLASMTLPSAEDPAIEALRGVAALMVMATHYTRFVSAEPGAWGFASTGVDLFFVLSGFVFAPYFFGKLLEPGPHLVRRFFRLYPLYLVALFTYVALKLPDPAAWRHLGSHLVMGHTLESLSTAFYYNPAFWSLPAEVEFYLLLPLIAIGFPRLRFGLVFVLALLAHLLLVAMAVPDEGVTARAVATVHLPGLLIEFCLGAWAWSLARGPAALPSAGLRLLLGLAVLACAIGLYAGFIAGPSPAKGMAQIWVGGNMGLVSALGYALVVSALAGRAAQFSGWRLGLCLLAGQLSYGLYLFHNASPQLLERAGLVLTGWPALLACVVLTVLLAWGLHHLVEAPLRDLGRRLSRRLAQRRLA